MTGDGGQCLSESEIGSVAAGVAGAELFNEHAQTCQACRERVQNARFERQFAEALRVGVKRADDAPSLAGYEIVGERSRGGQGIVYEAVQIRTRRRVAIKVLRQDNGVSRTQRARFEREIEIAAALKHTGIVAVYDSIAMSGGRHALVLELIEGVSLDRAAWSAGAAGTREMIGLMAEVCDAIHYAHQRGVIHRDLKPSNILVDQSGRARLLDFGVACWSEGSGAMATRITITGEFAGTLAYAAPEQVSGKSGPADSRSDLYAIGVMLYQLCFGKLPYSVDGSLAAAIGNITDAEPQRPTGTLRMDEDLWTIIGKSLAKEPARRYQSAEALGADLRRYLSGETIEARRDSRMYVLRKTLARHRYATGAVLAAFAGLAAFSVVVAMSNTRLSDALRQSNFERGRALAAAGTRPDADLLLWPEILRLGPALNDPSRALFHGTPEQRRVLWAFTEMQGSAPCLASAVASGGVLVDLDVAQQELASLSHTGEYVRWSMPELKVLSRKQRIARKIRRLVLVAAKEICVADEGDSVACIDLATGRELARRELPGTAWGGLRISKDGSVLAVWEKAFGIRVLELPSLRPIFQWRDAQSESSSPWLSERGDRIGILNEDREMLMFRLPDGGRIGGFAFRYEDFPNRGGRNAVLQNVDISASGALMAVTASHEVLMGRTTGDAMLRKQSVSTGSKVSPLFSPSEEWLLTRAISDPIARVWRTSDWEECERYPGHQGEVRSALFAPDEKYVVTADAAGVIRVWPGPRGAIVRSLSDSGILPHDVALDPASESVYAAGSDGRVGRWKLDGSAPPTFVRGDESAAFTVAFSPVRGLLVSAGGSGKISVFGSGPDPTRAISTDFSGGISCARFSPDGGILAVSGRFGPVVLYDTATFAEKGRIATDLGRIVMIRWSPDGAMLAVAGASVSGFGGELASCAILDSEGMRVKRRWDAHPGACRAIEFSPDGRLLATTGNDGVVRLHESSSGDVIGEVAANNSTIFCMAFHAGGHVLAVGDRSGRVTLIGLPESQVLAHFDAESSIMALAFSQDRLVVAPLLRAMAVRDFGAVAGSVKSNAEFWRARLETKGRSE